MSPHEVIDMLDVNAQMLSALLKVRKIISEGAMTGFNCHDGDWAKRLYESQQVTSAAIAKAEGR